MSPTPDTDTPAIDAIGWRFDNSYARLPATLFARVRPEPVRAPQVVVLNAPLGEALGLRLGDLRPVDAAALFAGQVIPAGADPIAQAYAGHQFGGFTMLGDGRAILLGEHLTPDGRRVDVQFKGSGQTPFSRRGDGRAALGPMLREYVVSEAMHALGIPTTRSLAVVTTGEWVYREGRLRGAILTRIAASHLRVGTFEYLAARRDFDTLRALADYAIARHDPDLADRDDRYLGLLRAVSERQAVLIAQWMGVGFVHGVMNTDNASIAGETIDYGPCAFLDRYDPATVFSSIDHYGRYAYDQQPGIAQWNLARFAEALLPLLDPEPKRAAALATDVLEAFPALFQERWLSVMRAKLGLSRPLPGDDALVAGLLAWMHDTGADFTTTFRALADGTLAPTGDDARLGPWLAWWEDRLGREGTSVDAARAAMRRVNPAVIARNHRVEEALAAAQQDDLAPLERLVDALRRPFDGDPRDAAYFDPPPEDASRYRTFCGT
jgi:uncharacterized protein YdiU (UPF0061 family)